MTGLENVPKEQFPDSAYRKRLGYKTYDEALIYDGEALYSRIEFKLLKGVPVPWFAVRRAIEGQVSKQNHKLLRLGLWRGPEVKGFANAPVWLYKLEITEHGSPVLPLIIGGIIAAIALLLGAGALLVIAVRADPIVFKRASKFIAGIPGALKWVAAAAIGYTLLGAVKTLKP